MEKQTKKGKAFVNEYDAFKKSSGAYGGALAILEDAQLSSQSKILFHIIASYCYVEGYCFASNKTLMSKLGLGKTRLHTYLLELETNRLIRTNQIATDNGPRRHICLDFEGLRKRYKKAMKG
jgi:hypothetical protein